MLPVYIFALLGLTALIITDTPTDEEEFGPDEPDVDPDVGVHLVPAGASVEGTDGDDVILTSDHAPRGTGYVVVADGGGGDGEVCSAFDTPPETSELVELMDFEVGVDQIQIDASVSDDSYSVTDARLVEDEVSGITQLIVHDDAPATLDLSDRDMIVLIHATGVTWDDISFVGDHQPPLLQPLA